MRSPLVMAILATTVGRAVAGIPQPEPTGPVRATGESAGREVDRGRR
ncbi:hypothetical protein ACFP2T_39300 [Plantactinospora solaniradicis]|uniref:Uncharacterized protein n=1 Tax=Plantactinospora solaniradicis TaxID=1723736 RepID=A0ABW1KMM4_9ACTN